MKIVYQYGNDGYYAGTNTAYNGLMPHNCTDIEPEVHNGFIPRWNGSAWEQVELEASYSSVEAVEKIEMLVQLYMDSFAQSAGYDNMLSACSYAVSANERYAKEGKYCMEMRDATWTTAYAALEHIAMQDRYTESELEALWEQIKAGLPMLGW